MNDFFIKNGNWLGTVFVVLGFLSIFIFDFKYIAPFLIFLCIGGNIKFYRILMLSDGVPKLIWGLVGLWFNFLCLDYIFDLGIINTQIT